MTGKGVGKEGGGVLRNAVPRWLNEAPNRDKVLAFEYARPKDGGAGALYVLLSADGRGPWRTPLGVKLRELRRRKGVTLSEMAEALDVTPAYLSALEHGKRGRPTTLRLHQICAYFDIIWDEADDSAGSPISRIPRSPSTPRTLTRGHGTREPAVGKNWRAE